ncbi:MAG TPA: alpha/beta hydrolase [Geobacteraceae bacterium]
MKLVQLFAAVCFFLLSAPCPGAVAEYGYPITDPYEATILGTPAGLKPQFPGKMRVRQLVLSVIPDRHKPPIFFYDEGLCCTLAYQNHKAPLVFLIAGSGSSNAAPKALTMMKALYQAGFHVISLPSTTHPNFIISASRSSMPGDLAEDAADLYLAMEHAWNEVRGDIEASAFFLAGYSLGGTQAAFVARRDEEKKLFNFRKVLMINPSVDLYGLVTRIEELLQRVTGGTGKEGVFFNRMLGKFTGFYRYGNFIAFNDDFLYAAFAEHILTRDEEGGLIGLSYRINSAGMIFSSDVMTNGGYVVPKNRVLSNTDSLYDYFQVSVHLSFFNYVNEYLYPYFRAQRPGLTRKAFLASQGLKSLDGYLRSSAKFGAMTNGDDFILSPEDLAYLREVFGDRVKIYSRGGHLGNLEYAENLAYMVDFFQEKAPDGGAHER